MGGEKCVHVGVCVCTAAAAAAGGIAHSGCVSLAGRGNRGGGLSPVRCVWL